MATVIELPKLSDTMEEGRLAEWLKKEGDQVEEGEALAEIETDKATVEYASPEEGVLLKIIEEPGTTLALGAPIAVFGSKGESFDLESLLAGHQKDSNEESKAAEQSAAPNLVESDTSPSIQAQVSKDHVATPAASTARIKASPLAKKMAQSQGVELTQVTGSGPGGRIIARDIKEFKPAPAAAYESRQQALQARTEPHSMMRATIAKRLVSAKNEAPHFYLNVSANMEAITQWRQKLNNEAGVSQGSIPKVSVNDLVLLAVSKSLRLHPQVNASWTKDAIIYHSTVDVAMAVALPEGLITPILFGSDRLGVREIATLTKELGRRAKDSDLKPEEYSGGTFTVSNLGMTGVESFTAIINPPQSCILAVGSVKTVPHVDEQTGELIAQRRMKMTMSCDHRVVDGMVGAQFLKTLVSYLEDPLLMLA